MANLRLTEDPLADPDQHQAGTHSRAASRTTVPLPGIPAAPRFLDRALMDNSAHFRCEWWLEHLRVHLQWGQHDVAVGRG
jgi:hypothetical protein